MPILTAITAIFTAIGFSAAVAGAIANFIISLGISVLSGMLNKPKVSSADGYKGELELGEAPYTAIYGRHKTQGRRLYYNRYGKGNKYNQFVFELSLGWCHGLADHIIVKNERKDLVPVAVVNNEIARYHVDGWDDKIVIRFYDGRPGQTADPELVANANPVGNWTTADTLTQTCYASVTFKWNEKLFASGFPDIWFVLDGLRCYDWRKDSTMPGGSGAHRLNDSATWEFTHNPVVQRYNYQLGIAAAHSGKILIGEGIPQGGLDHATYTFSANVADETRTVESVDYPKYVCGMIVKSEQTHGEVRDFFDNAISGYAVDRSGLEGVIAGAPQVSAGTLTDADIRIDEDYTRRERRPMAERFNRLTGVCVFPDKLYERDSYNEVTDSAWVDMDKGPLPQGFDLPQVNIPAVAQYVAENRARQNRKGAAIDRLPVSQFAVAKYEPGDWVEFDGKTWLITEAELPADRRGWLSLAETGADIYGETERNPVPVIDFTPPGDVTPTPAPQNPTISADLIVGAGGAQIPVLRLGYDVPEDVDIDAVIFEYRVLGADTVYTAREDAPVDGDLTGEIIVAEGVFGGQLYEMRCAFVTTPATTTTWSAWVQTLTTTDQTSVLLVQMAMDTRELIANLRTDLEQLREIVVTDGLTSIAEDSGNAYLARRVIQKTAGDALARVTTEETVRANADSALAAAVTAVETSLGGLTASGLLKIESSVGPEEAYALVAFFARVSTEEAFGEASFFLKVEEDGEGGFISSAGVSAGRFFIADDETDFVPFSVIDGEIVFNGVIRNESGTRRIDANGVNFISMDTE